MSIKEYVHWQWQGYLNYHHAPLNLLIHLLAVPLFMGATLSMLRALISLEFLSVGLSGLVMALAMAAQGYGHAREQQPALPFAGVGDALIRIFLEQFVTFPRFVCTGHWWRAFRGK